MSRQNGVRELNIFERILDWISESGGLVNLYTLTSVCIFSILLFRHFVGFWQGEFVQQLRASLVGDQLLYSHDLNVWFRGDIVRRN